MRKKPLFIYISTFVIFMLILLASCPINNDMALAEKEFTTKPEIAATLEDADKILITNIEREVNFTSYGLVHIGDKLKIKNIDENPVDSFLFGIPKVDGENLIFLEILGDQKNTLLFEKESLITDQFELISVFLEEPILPLEIINVSITQTYKDRLDYSIINFDQRINYTGYIFPILPYIAEGNIFSTFRIPESASFVIPEDTTENVISYNLSTYISGEKQLRPFLENLGTKKNISFSFSEGTFTKMEVIELNREIYISPWGIIEVSEDYLIQNVGEIDISSFSLIIPGDAKSIFVSDKLGEISGVIVDPEYNYTYDEKDLSIDLSQNRVRITKNSKFRFNLKYNLPIENYISFNWIQESIRMNIFTTKYDFLGRSQRTQIILDGVFQINFISHPPNAIEYTLDKNIIIYESELVSPKEKRIIQFRFTLNIFTLILRPLIFILCLISLASVFVVVVKTKRKDEVSYIMKEQIPTSEIREFTLLLEERSALLIENRSLLDDLRHKRVTKPKFKNIINRNDARIEEIKTEIDPIKEVLVEASETFANIVKRIEVLEAERLTVKDSLNLLEVRYKKGKLPSKTAYEKLLGDFIKRRDKIDRTIDRLIQQLRSYLLK